MRPARSADASSWVRESDMHHDLAALLEFPDYGRNLNALNDCLSDVAAAEYGVREGPGFCVALAQFRRFAGSDRHCAQSLLDILARQARSAALIGNRMMCLLQSNDPRLSFEPVGAMPVLWNDAEWLDSNRGL